MAILHRVLTGFVRFYPHDARKSAHFDTPANFF